MRCRLSLSLLLVAPTGCFSEPPGTSSSSGDSGSTSAPGTTERGDTSGTSGTSETEDDTSATTSAGTTSVGATTDVTTGSTTTGFSETEGVEVEVLFDFYARSCDGTWETMPIGPGAQSPCALTPVQANTQGGVWKYPQFSTPQFRDESEVLILRPFPEDGGSVLGSFSAAGLPTGEGATLALGWEFVNTAGPENASLMTFQLRVGRPAGSGATLVNTTAEALGESGTVNMQMSDLVMGPMDTLEFSVMSETYVEGQGVALYSAVIYEEL